MRTARAAQSAGLRTARRRRSRASSGTRRNDRSHRHRQNHLRRAVRNPADCAARGRPHVRYLGGAVATHARVATRSWLPPCWASWPGLVSTCATIGCARFCPCAVHPDSCPARVVAFRVWTPPTLRQGAPLWSLEFFCSSRRDGDCPPSAADHPGRGRRKQRSAARSPRCWKRAGYTVRPRTPAATRSSCSRTTTSTWSSATTTCPSFSGIDLLKLVRVRHPHVVRIIITADKDPDTAVRSINESEVYRFIRKP